jgi:hypothetical protein
MILGCWTGRVSVVGGLPVVARGAVAVALCSALLPGIVLAQAPADSAGSSPSDSGRSAAVAPDPPAWPWHQARIVPDQIAVFDLQSRLTPRSRVRLLGDFGQADLDEVSVTSEGVSGTRTPRVGRGQVADTAVTIPWPIIRSVQVMTRGWKRGAEIGTMVGAAPGLVLLQGSLEPGNSPFTSALAILIGVPLAAAGAVGGCTVGALVGGGILSHQTLHSSPVVSILANPANLPVRTIAVGGILENGKRPRDPAGLVTSVVTALEFAGFRVVEADKVPAVAGGEKRRRRAGSSDAALYPGPVLDRIREQTGADAVISGWIATGGADGDQIRCGFQMIHTRTHEVFMTSEMTAAYPGALESDRKERVVQEALGNLGALRNPVIAPREDPR